ncbi:MAG: hypothetical protein HFJ36_01770 [Clostridia bacterium]|nr:hypothetical protein [Clostridia bacterium]
MNKNHDDYLVGGETIANGENNKIIMPPEKAKNTLKSGVSINYAKDDSMNMTFAVSKHKCRGKDGKVSNRILRDGRNIKAGINNIKEQEER